MTFNFLGPGLTVNVEAKVKEQIILDSSGNLFETALYWFASTFNLTAEFAKIRGGLDEFFWAMESIFEGLFHYIPSLLSGGFLGY